MGPGRWTGRFGGTPAVLEAPGSVVLPTPDVGTARGAEDGKGHAHRVRGHQAVPPPVARDGAAFRGTARLLDALETVPVRERMRRRSLMYRLVLLTYRIARRERPLTAVAVTA